MTVNLYVYRCPNTFLFYHFTDLNSQLPLPRLCRDFTLSIATCSPDLLTKRHNFQNTMLQTILRSATRRGHGQPPVKVIRLQILKRVFATFTITGYPLRQRRVLAGHTNGILMKLPIEGFLG